MGLSNATAYKMGCQLSVRLPQDFKGRIRRVASAIQHPAYISQWFSPIAFVRWREFQYAFSALHKLEIVPRRLLDIASPKLFPITIAHEWPDCRVDAIDLVEPDLRELQHGKKQFCLFNLNPHKMDARTLDFPDQAFDAITSISVVEHISPEHGGDSQAMAEMRRTLKPGGVSIIIVPFSRTYFAEYVDGAVYGRQSEGPGKNFYQRFYDCDRLQRDIIDASGMELIDLLFVDERHPSISPHKRYAKAIAMNHDQIVHYGLLYPVLSHILLSAPKPLEKCRKPYIACLTLRRPRVS
jgi:ubiquinone/menaquinone biosynthesis C-methylase UbiE